jgi:outer membrane protein insertion porin family
VSCRICRILAIFLVSGCVALAQRAETNQLSYKLLSIQVKGLEHFTRDQVIAASGLRLGELAGDREFEQAAQKLGETGLFSQLTYTYKYSTAGCDLELQVAENLKLVPVIFNNFVWFSDSELIGLLHNRLPLFDGRVPPAGNFTDQVAEALSAILNQRKISGEVEGLPYASVNGPVEAYQYKLGFHAIVVRKIDFPGAAADDLPLLQAASSSFAGEDYLRTRLRVQEQFNLLPVYHARGFLKAQIADAQAQVAEDGARTLVDVSLPVARGIQYKLREFEFKGNTVFPADKLRELIHLKLGEPANSVQLADDLDQIRKLYGTKGYLFASLEPAPTMDDSSATVSYQIKVNENDLYRMGELTFEGIPEENATRMAAQWQMKKGDAFDDSYVQRFFGILYRDFGLKNSYEVVQKQAINRQDKTVSVNLRFVPRS